MGTVHADSPVVRRTLTGNIHFYGNSAADFAAVGAAMLDAEDDASPGDNISVYADAYISASLGKNLVNWNFADVTITADTGIPVFWDVNSAMNFSVNGMGSFISTDAHSVFMEHNDAKIFIRGKSILCNSGTTAPLTVHAGKIKAEFLDRIECSAYDTILGGTSAGRISFKTDQLLPGTAGDAIEIGSATVFGYANELGPCGDVGIWCTDGHIHLIAGKIPSGYTFSVDGSGSIFISCPDVNGVAIHGEP